MKVILISLAIVFCLGICDAKIESKCPPARTTEADQCARDGFFLLNPTYTGHNGNNADVYCKSLVKSVACIDKFNKECLKGFTKQSATAGLTGLKKHSRSVCGENAPKKAEFLQKTKWITKKEIDILYPCAQASIKNMNDISETISSNEQIPQSCCNYLLTRTCLSKKISKLTNETNKKFVESTADEALGNLISFLCSSYKVLKECKQKMPQAMARMFETFKNPGPKQKFESYLIPFLDVLSD